MRLKACLLAVALPLLALLLLARALPARAAGVVGTGDPSQCDFSHFVTALGGGGLVTFNCGPNPVTITVPNGTGIIPNGNTIVDGGTLGKIIIAGASNTRLWDIWVGSTITFTNLVFANAAYNSNGAVIQNAGYLLLDNVLFRHNTATGSGGAIYNAGTGLLHVQHTTFQGNSGTLGGALYNSGTVVMTDTHFLNNFSNTDNTGGAIYNTGVLHARTTTFQSNSAYACGGIYNSGAIIVLTDTTFLNNIVDGYGGGAILNTGALTMTGGLFTGNTFTVTQIGDGVGGAALQQWYSARALLTSVTFFNNDGDIQLGGAIFNDGRLDMVNSTIISNSAGVGAGVFVAQEGVTFITNTLIADNYGGYVGGGAYTRGQLTLTDLAVRHNRAPQGGGLMSAYDGHLTLNHVTVSDNTTNLFTDTNLGGGLLADGAALSINHSQFSNNQAGQGGGLYITADQTNPISIQNSTFANNYATNGGGVAIFAPLTLENDTLSGNVAGTQGGGLLLGAATLLRNVTVANNQATSGGALSVSTSQPITLVNTLLADSPAGGNCYGNPIDSAKYSLSSDGTCTLPGTGNQTGLAILLSALGNYGGPTLTHMLLTGSPAINGVTGADAPAFDQRGEPRPAGGNYDIGAVERQADDSGVAPRMYLPGMVK